MILRSLIVSNFAGLNPGARIDAFSPGITVIHGPNESGKSSLFQAIEYVLYQRYSAKGEKVESVIVPAGTKIAPQVTIVFEHGGGVYRLIKRFVKSPEARLAREMAGNFEDIAHGDHVDQKLRDILGHSPSDRGPTKWEQYGIGQILLVPQRELHNLTELGQPAVEGLRGVIKDVGTGGDTVEILKKTKKLYDAVFTPTGGLRANSESATIAKEIEDLDRTIADLGRRIAEAEEIEERLKNAERPADEIAAERALRVDAKEKALALWQDWQEKKAILTNVEALAETAAKAAAEHRRLIERLAQLQKDRESAAARLLESETRAKELADEAARQTAIEDEATKRLAEIDAEARELLSVERSAIDAREAKRADARRTELLEKLAKFDAADLSCREAEKSLAEKPRPKAEDLAAFARERKALEDAERALERLEFSVSIAAESALTIKTSDGDLVIEKGADGRVSGLEPLAFEIPGVGRFVVSGPPSAERGVEEKKRSIAETNLRKLTAPFGTSDPLWLEQAADERKKIEKKLELGTAARSAIFGQPTEAQKAREESARTVSALETLIAAHPEWGGACPAEPHIATLERSAADLKSQIDRRRVDQTKARDAAKDARKKAEAPLAAAQKAVAEHRTTIARIDAEKDAIAQGRPDAAAIAAKTTELDRLERERAADLVARKNVLDVMGDPKSAIDIAEKALTDFERQVSDAARQAAQLFGELKSRRGQGLHGQLTRATERRAVLIEKKERADIEAAAVRLLHDTLLAEQIKLTSAVVKPISDRVLRMVRHVYGRMVTPRFGESFLPEDVALRDDASVGLDRLSAGARDQLMLLTRLGFGEVYAKERGRHAFILDDPLVNTDRDRRARLLEILVRATRDLQIIIFTCHPEHYHGLPEASTTLISLEDAKMAARADAERLRG